MIYRSELFILVVIIVAVSVYAQKKGKGKSKKGAKNPLASPTEQCPLRTDSPQFATPWCRVVAGVDNVFLPTLPLPLQNLTADQVCEGDCRCAMGAKGGGKCGPSPVDGKIYCRCEYEKTVKPDTAVKCLYNVFHPLLTNLCQNSAPNVGGLLNNTLCINDCICSHGFDPKQTHPCSTKNGVRGNKVEYCVCNKAMNK